MSEVNVEQQANNAPRPDPVDAVSSDSGSDSSTTAAVEFGIAFGTESSIDALIRGVSQLAWLAYLDGDATYNFVSDLGDRYAYIRLSDLTRPVRFLRQMAGAPPLQLGAEGFRADILDDENPARHYTALLFVGFHAPAWLAIVVLYAWELAGFVRYRGHWSWADIRSGLLGIRHGKLVRTYGPTILPALIAAQLAEKSDDASCDGASSGSESTTLRAA